MSSYLKGILIILLSFICLQINAQNKLFKMQEHLSEDDYLPKTIIFKIKPEYSAFCNERAIDLPKLNQALTSIKAKNYIKKFPGKTSPSVRYNQYGEELVDLSLIYELTYEEDILLESAINKILSTGLVEYAEPHYVYEILDAYNPNDPRADTTNAQFSQWHLKKIKAYQAWGIQQGDTNIVIGISDTGTDLNHAELNSSIKKNYADPINGLDDDGDGFSDNYYGYDLGEEDSIPQVHAINHGVHVAGLSSAVVNNLIGVAGTGFKCKYLPLKIDNASGSLTRGYESIVYAVDHGCSIVNCSWGGMGGAGEFGQSIINYATYNMNALVVAACGNSHNSYPFYPAAYDNVLSVAATDINDCKWISSTNSGSSWGTSVDIAAPGAAVWSTWINGGYVSSSGTSMAAPIVSGAAAIVKAQNPSYSALQIAAQLMATTDNIYTIPANEPYIGMLGTGRLNMYKALTSNSPWINMKSNTIDDHNDMTFVSGDTLYISGVFKNFLISSNSALNVTLSTLSPYITIIKDKAILGTINTLEEKNVSDAFIVKILPGVPISSPIDFKLIFNDPIANYTSTQYFSIIVNVDYITIDTNQVSATITSKGKIGYNQQNSSSQGIGVTYKGGKSLLKCGSFMVGNSTAQVSDNVYGSLTDSYDDDFKTANVIYRVNPPLISDFETISVFNDSLAETNKMNLTIRNKTYTWNKSLKDKFIVLEYTIKNHGLLTLSSLYAGLFADFDLGSDGTRDRIAFDVTNKMGYTYSVDGGTYAAIKLLSNGILHHYAFDKNGAFNGYVSSINIIDGFNSYEKYSALKVNSYDHHDIAGVPNGNDVADLISTGPFILQPGDSVVVAFALIAGDHLADIQASATQADQLYNQTGMEDLSKTDMAQITNVYPNPAIDIFMFDVLLPESTDIQIELRDINGKLINSIHSGKLIQGTHSFKINTAKYTSGIYYIQLFYGNKMIKKGVTIIK